MATNCLVVMYHYVRDSSSTAFPAIRALRPDLFEQQLDWLQREHTLISLHDLESAFAGRAELPPRAALLTFDDGLTDHYETVFPILRRRDLSGVFFLARQPYEGTPRMLGVHKVQFLLAHLGSRALADAVRCLPGRRVAARRDQTSAGPSAPAGGRPDVVARGRHEPAMVAAEGRADVVFGADPWEHADERSVKTLLNYEMPFDDAERILDALFAQHVGSQEAFAEALYLREPMIAEMASAGMSFGYHTHSHRMLSRLSDGEQERELRDGVDWIARLTGQSRVSFCYPWGGAATYTSQTVRLLEQLRYSVAFTSVRRRADVLRDVALEVPRIDTRDLPPYVPEDAGVSVS